MLSEVVYLFEDYGLPLREVAVQALLRLGVALVVDGYAVVGKAEQARLLGQVEALEERCLILQQRQLLVKVLLQITFLVVGALR